MYQLAVYNLWPAFKTCNTFDSTYMYSRYTVSVFTLYKSNTLIVDWFILPWGWRTVCRDIWYKLSPSCYSYICTPDSGSCMLCLASHKTSDWGNVPETVRVNIYSNCSHILGRFWTNLEKIAYRIIITLMIEWKTKTKLGFGIRNCTKEKRLL